MTGGLIGKKLILTRNRQGVDGESEILFHLAYPQGGHDTWTEGIGSQVGIYLLQRLTDLLEPVEEGRSVYARLELTITEATSEIG